MIDELVRQWCYLGDIDLHSLSANQASFYLKICSGLAVSKLNSVFNIEPIQLWRHSFLQCIVLQQIRKKSLNLLVLSDHYCWGVATLQKMADA